MDFKGMDRKYLSSKLSIAANLNQKEMGYWINQFSGILSKSSFFYDNTKNISEYLMDSKHFSINEDISIKIINLCSGNDQLIHMLLIAGLVILLNKYTGNEDIILGTLIYKQDIPGDYINTVLPLRIRINAEVTIKELLIRIRHAVIEAIENQNYPLEILEDQLNLSGIEDESPLFDTLLLLENIHDRSYMQSIKYNIVFSFRKKGGSIEGIVEYNSMRYVKTTIARIINHFSQLLEKLLFKLDSRLSEINLLSLEEKNKILYDFNHTELSFPEELTFEQLFENQVRKTPGNTAVVFENRHLTYSEFNEKSLHLAQLLALKGVKANQIVGLMVERSIELIVGLIALLKIGTAYLPIGPEYPPERIKFMMEDSGTTLALISNNKIPPEGISHFDLVENIRELKENSFHLKTPYQNAHNDPAYIIYTSGTTGEPKGVIIEKKSLANFIKGFHRLLDFNQEDALLSLTTVSFDIFGLEIMVPLAKGSKVIIGSFEDQVNPDRAALTLTRENITIFQLTPSRLQLFISKCETADSLKHLKYLLVGGEAFPRSLLEKVREVTTGKIYNLYGPTETTIWSTVKNATGKEPLNIGKPICNTNIYICDKNGALQPIGIPGELCIAGTGVARGYLNRVELTNEKFVKIQYKAGTKIYKTGDLALWLPDGNIRFLGRFDHQVKIRGFRIEIAEIENQLQSIEYIKEAVVLPHNNEAGEENLYAYIVAKDHLTIDKLRNTLERSLPDYMIPSYFVQLEKIPLTPNGKVDRNALMSNEEFITTSLKYTAPGNHIENHVQKVWKEVLELDKISIYDNLFKIGGNSLKAVQIVSLLIEDFDITTSHIFKYQTIADLSAVISWKKDNLRNKIQQIKKSLTSPQKPAPAAPTPQFLEYKREYEEHQRFIEKEQFDVSISEIKYKNILLTGATGYLGAHLLYELLKSQHVKLHLLVRGETEEKARERIKNRLIYYFGEDFFENNHQRIEVLPADLKEDYFGLDPIQYETLSETVDTVVHSAANVSHFGAYSTFYEDNVLTTERLLEFALKENVKDFHYVSTLSVGSGNIKEREYALFNEFTHDIGQETENVYVRSKIEAEKKVFLYRNKGLNVSIYRVGNLVFHSGTGKFQENIANNAFYANLKAFVLMECIPSIDGFGIDMTFIDYTARAIILLMMMKSLHNETFHLKNYYILDWKDMVPFLQKAGLNIRCLSFDHFIEHLFTNLDVPQIAPAVQRLLLHSGLFEKEETENTKIRVITDRTQKILKKLGFIWPEVNETHIFKMVEHCREVGFF